MDISAPIAHNPSKFKRYLHETLMEGSVSQIFDIGPSLNVENVEINIF